MTQDKKDLTQERQDKLAILTYFKNSQKKVHINIILGNDSGRFRNGLILSIIDNRFLILDNVVGSCNYNIDEIDSKITEFREVGKC